MSDKLNITDLQRLYCTVYKDIVPTMSFSNFCNDVRRRNSRDEFRGENECSKFPYEYNGETYYHAKILYKEAVVNAVYQDYIVTYPTFLSAILHDIPADGAVYGSRAIHYKDAWYPSPDALYDVVKETAKNPCSLSRFVKHFRKGEPPEYAIEGVHPSKFLEE